jgi:hypothetical protein
MNAETRAKAARAATIASELYNLLDELQRELSSAPDFAGYILARDVQDYVFGRKSTEDVLGKLQAIASMGEKEKQDVRK